MSLRHNPVAPKSTTSLRWRLQTGRSGDRYRGLPQADHVPTAELPPAPSLDLSVHLNALSGEHQLGVGALVDEVGQLEQLTKLDRVAGDGYLVRNGVSSPLASCTRA